MSQGIVHSGMFLKAVFSSHWFYCFKLYPRTVWFLYSASFFLSLNLKPNQILNYINSASTSLPEFLFQCETVGELDLVVI